MGFPGYLQAFSLLLFALLSTIATPVAAGTEAISSIRNVRLLKPEQVRSHLPVRVQGVVTYCRGDGLAIFIQDRDEGICCMIPRTQKFSLAPGRRVEIEGVTVEGGYAVSISVRRWHDLGSAPLPQPAAVELSQLMSGRWDGRCVEVSGIARTTQFHSTGQWTIDIASGGSRVTATVELGGQADEEKWVDGIARIRGVAGVTVNQKGQFISAALRVYRMEDVVLVEPPSAQPYGAAARPIKSLMKFSPDSAEGRRVKVAGTVLHHQPDGALFIQDQSGGVTAFCRPSDSLNAGDQVEVLGFPTWGNYSPALEDATFRRIGPGPLQAPKEIKGGNLANGQLDGCLVQLDGTLAEMSRSPSEQLFIVKCGEKLLPTHLAPPNDALDSIRLGSVLRLTGVCRAHLAERQFRSGKLPVPVMELLLRSPSDMVILQTPPWWDLKRALWFAGGVSALLLAAMIWVGLLRIRVRAQTAIIADKVRGQAAAEERARVARELHDTVEQNLAAVAMHLDVIQNHGAPMTDVTRENLEAAFQQVRRTQEDAHRAVWDLRSPTLCENGLPAALEEMLTTTVNCRGVASHCEVQGAPHRLSGIVEHHLLRIAQEAITNALRHGEPGKISAKLTYEANAITLRVEDDGRGFDVEATVGSTPRFGLTGMRERAGRIGAALTVQSKPGHGVVVEVVLPAGSIRVLPAVA